MQFERLRKNHRKQIIIGAIAICVIGGALTFNLTRAKYKIANDLELAKGTINYKAYDFKIMAMYKSDDKENYTEIEEMPSEGYIVNEEKSYCTTDNKTEVKGKIKTINGNVAISNLNKNDKCFIWFDRLDDEKPIISNVTTSVTKTEINVIVTATDNIGVTEYWYQLDSGTPVKGIGNTHQFTGLSAGSTHTIKVYVKDAVGNISDTTTKNATTALPTASEKILENITYKTTTPDFSKVSSGDEGVYRTNDGLYGGYSYYWRGSAPTNHITFANKCWRIVRINGDNSLRLIYNGPILSNNTCANSGENSNTIVISSKYNGQENKSYFVGWTYDTTQRTLSGTASIAKTLTDNWYNNNLGNNLNYSNKITNGKYCNDRNSVATSGENYVWQESGSNFYYNSRYRIISAIPTLSCASGDVYVLKVGLITADEVMMAGGKYGSNQSYYLYNRKNYWTMSPSNWSEDYSYARMMLVNTGGGLDDESVTTSAGIRPVINLRSDVTFSGGDGTLNNPYIVQ